jgi:thiol:disulfide interchange protein
LAARTREKIPKKERPMPIILRPATTVLAALCAALLFAGTASLRSAAAGQPSMAELWNGAEIAWQEVGPGIRESSRTGKPVVMLFHASWCTSCKRYRQVWKDPGVVAASKSFIMILVDVDKDPDANGAFSPDGTYVPRTIFYTAEGDVMNEVVGKDAEYPHTIDLDDPTELRTLMQKAAGRASPPAEEPAPDRRAEN